MELTLEDVKWGRKHNPYTQVGSGSYAPPEYVEDRTESTAAETVFSFMGKAVLAASMASQCWGVTQSITPAELLASSKGFRPIISGEAIQIIEQPQADVQVLPSIEEQIKTIADWLNPGGMSGVATLLGVSRPTIYKWLEGTHGIKDENQKRLMQLTEAVDYWRKQIAEPMPHGLIRRHLPSDTTLFDLLSEPELDLTKIHDAINLLARSQQRSLESIKNLESAINGGKASST